MDIASASSRFEDKDQMGGFVSIFSLFTKRKSNLDKLENRLGRVGYICEYNLPVFYPITDIIKIVIYMTVFDDRSEKILKSAIYRNGCYHYFDAGRLNFFIDDWSKLGRIVDIIREYTIDDRPNVDTKLSIIKSNIRRFESNRENNYRVIMEYLIDKYENIKLTSLYIGFDIHMQPDGFVQHGELINSIPEKSRTIRSVKIYYCADHKISSLKITETGSDEIVHPNCDRDGWYCLGDYKNMKMVPENIEKVLDHLKIYNMDDTYSK